MPVSRTDNEYAFSTWKLWARRAGDIGNSLASGTYILYEQNQILLNTQSSAFGVSYLDPADFAGSRTAKVRLRITYHVGATAPGNITITWGIAAVATWRTGTTTDRAGVATLGTTLTSAAVTNPAAGTHGHLESTEATISAADYYAIFLTLSGSSAASSNVDYGVDLLRREVTS